MRKKYGGRLTKEMLLKSGITEITIDGRIFKGTRELKGRFSKNNADQYRLLTIYDFDKNMNKIKVPSETASYNYKLTLVSFHRAIYAWFFGEVPEGYVVDHIDDNKGNNSINNLQLLTPRENLQKSRPKAKYMPQIGRKKIYTREYVEAKLAEWTARAEKAKAEHNAKEYHDAMTGYSQWRRRKEILFGEDEE